MSTHDRCPARLELADDYGDNFITFHCQRKAGHVGPHQEWNHKDAGTIGKDWFIVAWEGFEPQLGMESQDDD